MNSLIFILNQRFQVITNNLLSVLTAILSDILVLNDLAKRRTSENLGPEPTLNSAQISLIINCKQESTLRSINTPRFYNLTLLKVPLKDMQRKAVLQPAIWASCS